MYILDPVERSEAGDMQGGLTFEDKRKWSVIGELSAVRLQGMTSEQQTKFRMRPLE